LTSHYADSVLAIYRSTPSWRRAGFIAGLGILGVVSLLASTVIPPNVVEQSGLPETALRLLVLIQPAVLVIGAAVVGDRLTGTTHLNAPFISGTRRVPIASAVLAAFGGAVAVGSVLTIYNWVTSELAPVTLVPGTSLSLLTGVLYGGLTEEVLIRWGLMGVIVWILMKLTRRNPDQGPSVTIAVTSIAITSVTFAVLHFPALFALTDPSITIVVASLIGNVLAGAVFGVIFAARGLESAMGAHAGAHMVGATLSSLVVD
jgi:hypothetical protein